MKTAIQALVAAVVGAAVVWTMFWLVESVLPNFAYLPWEAQRLLILVAVLAAALMGLRGSIPTAASLIGGAGVAWALHEINPLSLCPSGALYRPCTTGEIAWMVVPPIALLLIAGATAVSPRQTGSTRRAIRNR